MWTSLYFASLFFAGADLTPGKIPAIFNYYLSGSTILKMRAMKTVIIGPSFYAAGRALRSEDDVLVIGRNSSIGDEWSYSHRRFATRNFTPWSHEVLDLLRETDELSLHGDNAIAISVLLYERLAACPDRFKLWTELESVKQVEDGFELTLYTVSGREVVRCRELIDSTVMALTCPEWGQANLKTKRLNMLVGDTTSGWEPPENFEGLTIRPGRTEMEMVVEFEVPVATTLSEARARLLEIWRRRPEAMRPWKITTFGAEFDCDLTCDQHGFAKNWSFVNPQAFDHPLIAFETGLMGGER
jgi:hypothetical protein